ncbi:MAG: Hsp20/alpha crystallin family protein [Trueperaceae bacterium]
MKIEKYGTGADVQELLDIRNSIGALLDNHANRSPLMPKADLLDLGHAFQLHIEVPGVELADLEIATDEDELHVAGLREPNLELGQTLVSERAVGPFQRTFQLPQAVDAEGGTAHLAAGVLVVTLPKRD